MRPLLVAATLLLAGCPTPDDRAALWTVREMVDSVRKGEPASFFDIPAQAIVTARGAPLPLLSAPYSTGSAIQSADFEGLTVFPAFAEGKPAAYVTAEIWYDWGPIWAQPLYLPVTAWDPASPGSKIVPGASPVFAVGERSTFYSPYWIVWWVVVPEGTPPEQLTTPKALLDLATELHEGAGKVCSVVPEDVKLAQTQGAKPVRPLTLGEVEDVKIASVWADGQKVSAIDFGNDRFQWDDEGYIVREDAIFAFAALDETGEPKMFDLPKVGGTGPFQSGIPAKAPNHKPAFGSLWRLYTAVLPHTAGVFVPSSMDALKARVIVQGLAAPTVAPEIEARADVKDYVLRVALQPACFADEALFPEGCQFLDSQAALESLLPLQAFRKEGFTINCPFVEYDGQKVPYP